MTEKPTTIDAYLAALPAEKRAALEALRKAIRAVAPRAEECVSYQLPAFRLDGKLLVGFGATANHCALYLMSSGTVEAHEEDLAGYDTSKGTIRFPADEPLPATLVRKLVKARIAENRAGATSSYGAGRGLAVPGPRPAGGNAMTTRKHTHEEVLPGTQGEVFALLCTPSAIRGWWSAARAIVLPERGGVWAATWGKSEDDPDFVTAATIRAIDPPRRLVLADYRYRARGGPLPFRAEFVTEFVVTPHELGAVLRVTQDGFPSGPEADAFYDACRKGWRDTFAGIRNYLASRP